MHIVSVSVELIDTPLPDLKFRQGRHGGGGTALEGILRLRTDDGLTGTARVRPGRFLADYVDRWLRDALVGADVSLREAIWNQLWDLDRRSEMPAPVLGAVDTALWDIAGQAAGMPVYQLLGGARSSIPAHASTATYDSIAEYLDVADQCRERGFDGMKIHAWGQARRDAQLCAALRDHVGDDFQLMYDGSAAFDLPDAVYVGRVLADNGYYWYEEPLFEHSVTAYRWLADRTRAPLLVAEVSRGAHRNAADFLMSGCASFVRASWQFKGGITGSMRIAHLADAFRVRTEVHGGPAGGLGARHLCLAIANTTSYEAVVWGNPIVVEPAVGTDCHVRVPDLPGLGWTPEDLAPDIYLKHR